MLSRDIYFQISRSPILRVMCSCRLCISRFFLDNLTFLNAVNKRSQFCCLVNWPAVSTSRNVYCFSSRSCNTSCRSNRIISLSKFTKPLFHLWLIKRCIHIIIICYPAWDQILVHNHILVCHLISDAGFQIIVHRITGFLNFRRLWSVLRHSIALLIHHI